MATNEQKLKKVNNAARGNLDIDSGELNNGPNYRPSNRRPGAQCLDVEYNDLSDLSEDGFSDSSSNDDQKCEAGDGRTDVKLVNYYECNKDHYFCGDHQNKDYCPVHLEEPRKLGY